MRILNKEVLDEFVDKYADAIAPVNRWIEIVENNADQVLRNPLRV